MIAGIILAAGKSERMGRLKPLLSFAGTTFLEHLYRLLERSSLGAVRVVLGYQAGRILGEIKLPPEVVVINSEYEKGMLSSVHSGLASLQELKPEAVMLFPVDHPNISLSLIERMISEFSSAHGEIIIPVHNRRRGHPVLFSSSLFQELMHAPLKEGARHVVRKFPDRVLEIETDEPGILQDIDTLEDYRSLPGKS